MRDRAPRLERGSGNLSGSIGEWTLRSIALTLTVYRRQKEGAMSTSGGLASRLRRFGRKALFTTAVLIALSTATVAVAHGPNSSRFHDYEGVAYHYWSGPDLDCSPQYAWDQGFATQFDGQSHTMTRQIRNFSTGTWSIRTDNFGGSLATNGWTAYKRISYAKVETNWHTFSDSYGAKTKMVVSCHP